MEQDWEEHSFDILPFSIEIRTIRHSRPRNHDLINRIGREQQQSIAIYVHINILWEA